MSKRLEQLMNMLQSSPKEPFLLFAIAKEHEKAEAWEKALEFYQTLERENPDYVGTYYHLGKLYELLGKGGQANQAYQKGMDVAKKAGDQHSLSELAGAKLELDWDED